MIRTHADAIGHALDGLFWAFQTQNNYKVHFALIFISVTSGLYFGISHEEWLVLIFTVITGLVIETCNTAIEQLGDAINTDFDIHIKRAKDVSAGAMLIYSIGAVIVACFIFIPKLMQLF